MRGNHADHASRVSYVSDVYRGSASDRQVIEWG